MFTIRFVFKDKSYRAYSVCRYDVAPGEDGTEVTMSRKMAGSHEHSEYVGIRPGDAHTAYVSNLDGKTIDVVRCKDVSS